MATTRTYNKDGGTALESAVTAFYDSIDADGIYDPSTVEAITTAYNTYHGSTTGPIVTRVTMFAMGDARANNDLLSVIIGAMRSVSTASARVNKPTLSDADVSAIRTAVEQVTASAIAALCEFDMSDLARAYVGTIAEKVAAQIANVPTGTKTAQPDLSDMLTAGQVTAGQVLSIGSVTGTVNADGTISVGGSADRLSVSKSARVATGQKSVNGYVAWRNADGRTLRSLSA